MFTTHICAYSIGVFGVVIPVWRLASWEIYIMCSQDMSVNAFKCLFLVVPLGWFWPKAGLATDELGPRNEDGCNSHGHSMLDWWICFSLFKNSLYHLLCSMGINRCSLACMAKVLALFNFLRCGDCWLPVFGYRLGPKCSCTAPALSHGSCDCPWGQRPHREGACQCFTGPDWSLWILWTMNAECFFSN